MTLAHFQRTFADTSGNVQSGIFVTVSKESDGSLATLFSDPDGAVAKANPFTTSLSGYADFYAESGRYRIQSASIDWRNQDLISQPELPLLDGGTSANFTAMPQVGGDPIVESGSNADGEWTRWADGTQVCSINSIVTIDFNNGTGVTGLYRSNHFTADFPAAFVSNLPNVQSSLIEESENFMLWGGNVRENLSLTRGSFVFFSARGSSATITIKASITAIGRWK